MECSSSPPARDGGLVAAQALAEEEAPDQLLGLGAPPHLDDEPRHQQPGREVGGDVGELAQSHLVLALLDDRAQELGLRREVVVDPRDVQVAGLGQLAHARGARPLVGHQLQRRVEDALALVGDGHRVLPTLGLGITPHPGGTGTPCRALSTR